MVQRATTNGELETGNVDEYESTRYFHYLRTLADLTAMASIVAVQVTFSSCDIFFFFFFLDSSPPIEMTDAYVGMTDRMQEEPVQNILQTIRYQQCRDAVYREVLTDSYLLFLFSFHFIFVLCFSVFFAFFSPSFSVFAFIFAFLFLFLLLFVTVQCNALFVSRSHNRSRIYMLFQCRIDRRPSTHILPSFVLSNTHNLSLISYKSQCHGHMP